MDRQEVNATNHNDKDLAATLAALRAMQGKPATQPDHIETAMAKLPGKGEWVKLAPAVAMVCGTILIITFVMVFAVLTLTGSPTDSFFRLINLFLNALGAIATLATLCVALLHARRTMENRRMAQANADEAHDAVAAARDAVTNAETAANAANASTRAAEAVNDALEGHILKALGPVVSQAVAEALRNQHLQQKPE